jgi:serine/threonine protein kinase
VTSNQVHYPTQKNPKNQRYFRTRQSLTLSRTGCLTRDLDDRGPCPLTLTLSLLETDNILYLNKSKNSPIKIADYGLAATFDPKLTPASRPRFTTKCGSANFVAPEVRRRPSPTSPKAWYIDRHRILEWIGGQPLCRESCPAAARNEETSP